MLKVTPVVLREWRSRKCFRATTINGYRKVVLEVRRLEDGVLSPWNGSLNLFGDKIEHFEDPNETVAHGARVPFKGTDQLISKNAVAGARQHKGSFTRTR